MSADAKPYISVIIPCRNEARHIRATVASLLVQAEPPGGCELLVVDGMSDDGTREILSELASREPRLKILDNPERITPVAFNRGIRAARGRVIVLMGAHNRYAPDYLLQTARVLEETGADNVGGAMVCEGENYIQRAIALAFHSPFAAGAARWHKPDYEGPADTVFGGAYRRELFERLGFFDEELVRNQDDEFNLRLARAGGKIWQSPRIKSWYQPRASLAKLFQQYYQYGYWKVRVIQKHKLPASIRHLVPGAFVVSLAGLAILALAGVKVAAVGLAALAGLYLLANLGASILTAASGGWSYLPIVPIVFAAYHFGYGLGFWSGVWKFVILKSVKV